MTEYGTQKPWGAEVFLKGKSIKKGLVRRLTESGAFVYDPAPPKLESPDWGEWFPFTSPNGVKTVVFEVK
jgi:hypothetical protein